MKRLLLGFVATAFGATNSSMEQACNVFYDWCYTALNRTSFGISIEDYCLLYNGVCMDQVVEDMPIFQLEQLSNDSRVGDSRDMELPTEAPRSDLPPSSDDGDSSTTDVPMPPDQRETPGDTPPGSDTPPGTDTPPGSDTPTVTDTPTGSDSPTVTDTPTGTDTPMPTMDTPVPTIDIPANDGGSECEECSSGMDGDGLRLGDRHGDEKKDPHTLEDKCVICILRNGCEAEVCVWNILSMTCLPMDQAREQIVVQDVNHCDSGYDDAELKDMRFSGGPVELECLELNCTSKYEYKVSNATLLSLDLKSGHAMSMIEVSHNASGTMQTSKFRGEAMSEIDIGYLHDKSEFTILVSVLSASKNMSNTYSFAATKQGSKETTTEEANDMKLDMVQLVMLGTAVMAIVFFIATVAYPLAFPAKYNAFFERRMRIISDNENSIDIANAGTGASLKAFLKSFGWVIKSKSIRVGNEVGRGASAQVFEGSYCGELVAVKKMYSSEVVMDQFQEFFDNEAAILTSLHHPNVVRFFGAVCGTNRLYLITEFCEHSLSSMVHKSLLASYSDAIWQSSKFYSLAIGIANGMQYLHSKNIVHRDLKPENVLLNEHVVKLCDFGMSKAVTQAFQQFDDEGTIGTPAYLAPEISSRKCTYASFKVDVYAFGVLMYYIWTRKCPYEDLEINSFALMERVRDGLRPSLPDTMPSELAKLLQSCWAADLGLRPNFKDIVGQLYALAGGRDLCRGKHIHHRLSLGLE